MPNLRFQKRDDGIVDPAASAPAETLADLLCLTEEAVRQMVETLGTVNANVADMKAVLDERLTEVTTKLGEVHAAIEDRTEEGVESADTVIQALDELAEALRATTG